MKSRLPLPDPSQLDADQQAVYDSILATRGSLDGPFGAWLHSPGLAAHAERLGAFCRYRSSLALVESELLILCVAARHRCIGEQQIHEPIALKAGLQQNTVDDIAQRRETVLGNERQQLLHDFAVQLLATDRVERPMFERARRLLGVPALVEAVGIVGYYALVAHTLNAFDMQKEAPAPSAGLATTTTGDTR